MQKEQTIEGTFNRQDEEPGYTIIKNGERIRIVPLGEPTVEADRTNLSFKSSYGLYAVHTKDGVYYASDLESILNGSGSGITDSYVCYNYG